MKKKKSEVNLSNPKYSTEWLKYYQPNRRYGLSFKPYLKSSKCNFRLVTDNHGLVNLGSVKSPNVICGTSFGQGVGVNIENTWFSKLKNKKDYFNISFPVGTINHLRRLSDLYVGSSNHLIYLYHPNNFICSYMFYESELKKIDIFKYMNWSTDLSKKYKFIIAYPFRLCVRRLSGRIVYFKGYKLDSKYCFFESCNNEFLKSESSNLLSLFSKFKHVYALRIPIREELYNLNSFESLKRSINKNYSTFLDFTRSLSNINHFDLSNFFNLSDYHKYDNHWNEFGNEKFFEYLKRIRL